MTSQRQGQRGRISLLASVPTTAADLQRRRRRRSCGATAIASRGGKVMLPGIDRNRLPPTTTTTTSCLLTNCAFPPSSLLPLDKRRNKPSGLLVISYTVTQLGDINNSIIHYRGLRPISTFSLPGCDCENETRIHARKSMR